MSEYHNNYKDPYLREYLKQISEKNKTKFNKCYLCENPTDTIIAKKHVIHPVCITHSILETQQDTQTTFE